jgi:acyl-CoA thioesterase FadM
MVTQKYKIGDLVVLTINVHHHQQIHFLQKLTINMIVTDVKRSLESNDYEYSLASPGLGITFAWATQAQLSKITTGVE